MARPFVAALSVAALILSLASYAAADSTPFDACGPAFCSNMNDKMGFISRTTVNGTNINYLSWQLGFYDGLWNNGVYPNKSAAYCQPNGPFVNLEVFQEVGLTLTTATVSSISECCTLCRNTFNCTMYHYYPTVTASQPNGKLSKTSKTPGFISGVNCYLLAGGSQDNSAQGSNAPYGVPYSGTHDFQLGYTSSIDASFLGGLCVNQSFVDGVNAAKSCDNFTCVAGSYFPGKFYTPLTALSTGFVDPKTSNPQTACYNLCGAYNVANPTKLASFWQYEDTGSAGVCTCYDASACTTRWNDTFLVGSSRFSVGKICTTTGKGDPHFKGADGSLFDFSGEPNKVYALVSDEHLQINAFFGGRYGPYNGNPRKALTWMRSVALLFGHHALLLEARAGPSAEYGSGYLGRLALDGEALPLPGVGDRLALLGGQLEVVQTKAGEKDGNDLVDVFEVRVKDAATVRLVLRPEIAELRTHDDGLVHFEVDLLKTHLSEQAHGILGQTYRKEFEGRLAKQELIYSPVERAMVVPGDSAEGFLDGSVADYQCSALDAANCRFCRFRRAERLHGGKRLRIRGGPAVLDRAFA